jgi:hypothetical protein
MRKTLSICCSFLNYRLDIYFHQPSKNTNEDPAGVRVTDVFVNPPSGVASYFCDEATIAEEDPFGKRGHVFYGAFEASVCSRFTGLRRLCLISLQRHGLTFKISSFSLQSAVLLRCFMKLFWVASFRS